MRKFTLCFAMLISAWLSAFAFDVDGEVSIRSGYNWRGLKINDGAVFQPSISISAGNFWAEAWGNMDLTAANDDQYHMNEVDFTIGYDWEFSAATLSTGAICYSYPGSDDPSTTEIFAAITLEIPLQPALSVYQDVSEFDGTFAELSISHTFPVFSAEVSDGLTVTAILGYGSSDFKNAYFNMGTEMGMPPTMYIEAKALSQDNPRQLKASSGLTDYGLSLELPIQLKQGNLTFSLEYYGLADSDIHSPGFETDDTNVIYGITYSRSF